MVEEGTGAICLSTRRTLRNDGRGEIGMLIVEIGCNARWNFKQAAHASRSDRPSLTTRCVNSAAKGHPHIDQAGLQAGPQDIRLWPEPWIQHGRCDCDRGKPGSHGRSTTELPSAEHHDCWACGRGTQQSRRCCRCGRRCRQRHVHGAWPWRRWGRGRRRSGFQQHNPQSQRRRKRPNVAQACANQPKHASHRAERICPPTSQLFWECPYCERCPSRSSGHPDKHSYCRPSSRQLNQCTTHQFHCTNCKHDYSHSCSSLSYPSATTTSSRFQSFTEQTIEEEC